ncbi:MAG: type IX secretion system membrane protein PorP/SprF [Flavobacterium sp.]|uniref:PorP/SprF family type IX secretion system membrane protein n=1 Tax=Flavobacterium sp. TaxID=239 RepID=UPI001224F899|nr:type IX secretion system membrane protein PorP/SprF [Flavobacterium sp.]RZJ67415.1 MAG: type IX secretion system membrane protein PorP/SprF [Flavobacterium sp.]
MRKNIKHIILTFFLLAVAVSRAQQDPQFTHYMYNMSVINPAYATDTPGTINVGGLYRTQWVGAVGAPKTVSAFVHSPVANRVEAGISIVSDEIGDVVKENNFYADVAYVIPVSDNNKLSFGVKGGATFFDANFNGFQYSDTNPDPAFANNIHRVFPNVGVGTFFFSDKYYLGFSVPNLLRTKHLERQDAIATIGVEEIHYFFTGGYVFDISDDVKLKPAMMAKGVKGAPMAFDFTANTLLFNRFELGVAYRLDDAIAGLAGFYITPELRFGYSYDYTLTNLGSYNSGTHEIFLLWDLNLSGLSGKGYDKSPRFF